MKPVKVRSSVIFRLVCSIRAAALLIGSFAALLFCGPGFSQGNLGRIAGAVKDQSGGAVVGATVWPALASLGTSSATRRTSPQALTPFHSSPRIFHKLV